VLLEEFHRNRREAMEEFHETSAVGQVEERADYLKISQARWRWKPANSTRFSAAITSSPPASNPNPDEKLFGMGSTAALLEYQGLHAGAGHRNSQASVPFLVSSLGYGFLWHNPAIGRVTFGKNVTEWHAQSRTFGLLDRCRDTPAEIEEAYARATGTAPMMPDYAMGFWQCKLRYQTQEELLEVAREYRARPCRSQ